MTDSTPFYGVRVPAEVRKTVKLLSSGTIDQKTQYRKILEPVLVYAEKGDGAIDDGLLNDESMQILSTVSFPYRTKSSQPTKANSFFFLLLLCHSKQIGVEFDACVTLFTGLYSIVKKVIRHNTDLGLFVSLRVTCSRR